MFVLLGIAIIAAIAPLVAPLVKILKPVSVESKTRQRSEKEMLELAVEGEIENEYEKLLELGFQPMGTNFSQIGTESNCDSEHNLVFHHTELPIAASLCVLSDGQRNVKFLSGDLHGRVLVTTSLKQGGINSRDQRGWYQTLDTSNLETVFEKHEQANNEWVSREFAPQSAETTQQFEQLVVDYLNMPVCRQMIHAGSVILGIGSLVFSLFFPAVITTIATSFIGDWSWLSPVNLFSITSLLGSLIWYTGVTVKAQKAGI